MAIYPSAKQRRLSKRFSGNRRMVAHNRVNLHVAVSMASSLHGYFNAPYRPSSHFYVRKNGVVEQYVDTDWRAEADGDGNDATISVETQGGLKNPNGEEWTPAQVEALAQLYAWAVKTHGIKLQVATSSHLGARSKGLSWHRLGIDGNFPSTGILRGRNQRGGGMHYSSSFGKPCPGSAKIKQIPGIFARAEDILAGRESSAPSRDADRPKPVKKPKRKKLKVDGVWGASTTRRLQEVLGTKEDGVVSSQSEYWEPRNPGLGSGWDWVKDAHGSTVMRALQKKIGMPASKRDGKYGPDTAEALQRHLGTPVDGVASRPSKMVKKLQRNLNKGRV